VESGSREENASNQESEVFHRFHEKVKDSSDWLRRPRRQQNTAAFAEKRRHRFTLVSRGLFRVFPDKNGRSEFPARKFDRAGNIGSIRWYS
jgi:hypothetical protein